MTDNPLTPAQLRLLNKLLAAPTHTVMPTLQTLKTVKSLEDRGMVRDTFYGTMITAKGLQELRRRSQKAENRAYLERQINAALSIVSQ